MATVEDNRVCDQKFSEWAEKFPECRTVLALSPSDYELRRLRTLFPAGKILALGREDWNLNLPWLREPVDLVTVCNVFHYSPNPAAWFSNVLGACRQLWIQDLVVRPRGNPQLGSDGDCCRFSWGEPLGKPSWPVFNLRILGERIREFEAYDAGSYRADALLINFVARIGGAAI